MWFYRVWHHIEHVVFGALQNSFLSFRHKLQEENFIFTAYSSLDFLFIMCGKNEDLRTRTTQNQDAIRINVISFFRILTRVIELCVWVVNAVLRIMVCIGRTPKEMQCTSASVIRKSWQYFNFAFSLLICVAWMFCAPGLISFISIHIVSSSCGTLRTKESHARNVRDKIHIHSLRYVTSYNRVIARSFLRLRFRTTSFETLLLRYDSWRIRRHSWEADLCDYFQHTFSILIVWCLVNRSWLLSSLLYKP